MRYDPNSTNQYQYFKSLQSKPYQVPPLSPKYILSPFYVAALPFGPSQSSNDLTAEPQTQSSLTPLEAITEDFLAPKSDDPLNQFLTGKKGFLAQSVEDILGLIYEREQLKYENLHNIDIDSCRIGSQLFTIEYWRIGQNPNIDKVRSQMERELTGLAREKRMEEVACWRDIKELRSDLREVMGEVSQEKRRENLLAGEMGPWTSK